MSIKSKPFVFMVALFGSGLQPACSVTTEALDRGDTSALDVVSLSVDADPQSPMRALSIRTDASIDEGLDSAESHAGDICGGGTRSLNWQGGVLPE